MKKTHPIHQRSLIAALVAGAVLAIPAHAATKAATAAGKPTVAEAERFIADSEQKLDRLGLDAGRAEWVAENFITLDTETMTAQANEQFLTVSGDIALKARRYNGLKVSEASARKLMLLQQSLNLENADDRAAYARLAASMTGAYGKAKYCPQAAAGLRDNPLNGRPRGLRRHGGMPPYGCNTGDTRPKAAQ